MKTVRFTSLVEACGRPEVHLAWSAPDADPVLQAAVKQHRVLTVHQHLRGAKKDFGVVGLDPARGAQFLIFSKSLRKFAEQHVVGIQYHLLAAALSVGPTPKGRKRAKPTPSPSKAANVVRFRLPDVAAEKETPVPPPVVRSVKPRPPTKPVEPVETDPVKIEIRKALADLSAGRTSKAKRRLEALLA